MSKEKFLKLGILET